MSKPWILISPASQGIGHALAKHLLRTTTLPIFATTRTNGSPVYKSLLQDIPAADQEAAKSRLTVTGVDVNSEQTVQRASQRALWMFPRDTHHLHLAAVLPGILRPERSPGDVEYDAALQMLRTNVLGPLVLMKHFAHFLPTKMHPKGPDDDDGGDAASSLAVSSSSSETEEGTVRRLPDHATWLMVSARVGSTTENLLGGWYTYRASKAGVNSLAKTFDLHLRSRSGEKAMAMAYHPGTVKTNLSKEFWDNVVPEKLFSPDFAAEKLVEVVCSRSLADRGRIWDWKGEEILP